LVILPDTKIGLEVHTVLWIKTHRYLPNVANEFATSPLVSPVGFQTETSGK
jgi:hypothetical protein